MSAAPRKRLTGQARRAAILDSALEVFAERGYHASFIDDIAGHAGISKALIYEHFSSKQQLYAELFDQHAVELLERLAAAVAQAGDAGSSRLEVGVDAFYRFVEERRGAWRILFREATDPEVALLLERIVSEVTALVAALIATDPAVRVVRDHKAREQGIQMLAHLVVGAVQSLANWWADHQNVPRQRMVERTMDFAWLGLERLSRGERWSATAS